ncbi:zinc finger protein 415-like [Zophobas morio]|uniref:zinc finger protein 415-like n=1 Tax=Zophobas morio TaxID=2755281 RepID=UPI0030831245
MKPKEMESTIKSKHVDTLCRVCLTASKNLVNLCTPINEKVLNFKEQWPIFDMLERVTFQKVILSSKFPSKLCQMCLSFLKIAYEFQEQFYSSQNLLGKVTEEVPVEKSEICCNRKESVSEKPPTEERPVVAVELIYGDNKFDLNDVLIVEDEKRDKISYDGFLKNLGSEVSAKFIHKHASRVHNDENCDDSVEVILINRNDTKSDETPIVENFKPNNTQCDKIDPACLKVNKYPNECKVVIQDARTDAVIKTLYECPVCTKPFATLSDLETHVDSKHTTQNFFMCEQCGHMAQTRSQLYHHMVKHKGKRFHCNFCDKKYDSISHLKVHLDVHKNERRHLCYHCGKSFNYAVSLKYHLRLHYDKKFVCNYCGLKYRMPNTLKRHLRTHTKDKPYNCGYCPKRFSSRGEQVSHEMLHTGVRPFHCEYCGKGYIKHGNLKEHHLTHSGPHQCNFCSKTFIDMKFLKIHMKRAHKDDDIVELPIDYFV